MSVSPPATMLPAVADVLDTAVESYCAILPAANVVMLVALLTGLLSKEIG